MNKFFLLLFIGVQLLNSSCEEETNKPVFLTLDVSDLTSEGVTLNGNIRFMEGHPITDYGFTWSTQPNSDLSGGSYSFGKKPEVGAFSYRIVDGLTKDQKYLVRTFVILQGETQFGNAIEFIGQGSATPEIFDVDPTQGSSLDTVTITGDHFGELKSATSIKIGALTCDVLSVSPSKIVFRIPLNYYSGTYPIELNVADKTVIASSFTLVGPVIQSMSPSSGPAGTIVTLSGTGFSSSPEENVIYFADRLATVLSATPTEVQVRVPVNNEAGEKEVSLKYNHAKSIAPAPFNLTGPVITSINPSSGIAGTNITITGSGFSSIPDENQVLINSSHYIYGSVISASPTELVVSVGQVNYRGTESSISSNISVEVQGVLSFSPGVFTIKGPTISSIIPSAQYEGRLITLTGENFDPNGDNQVYFSNYGGGLESSDANSITVKVPFGTPSLPAQCKLTVKSGGYEYITPNPFTILSPWEQLSDFPGGARYGVTTFTIGSYSYLAMGIVAGAGDKKDVWRFDPSNQSWTRMNDFAGPSRAFAFSFVMNGKAYVGGGGHYGGSSYNLISDHYDLWEYNPATDSWAQKSSYSPNGLSGKRFQATAIGNYAYFGANAFLYRYDPGLDQWWVFNSPVSFSDAGIAATIGDKGYFGLGVQNSTLWEFDPVASTWIPKTDSPLRLTSGWGLLSRFVLQGELYVSSAQMLVKYSPTSDTWSQLPHIPIELIYTGVFASDTKAYLVTGLNGLGYQRCYEFDPSY